MFIIMVTVDSVASECVRPEEFVSPDDDIVLIYTGAQRLVGQDSPVAHNDASFTAETEKQESSVSYINILNTKLDIVLMCDPLIPVQLLSKSVIFRGS